jgi:uncharacterized membrane protein
MGDTRTLFVLGYPDKAMADAAVAEMHVLDVDGFLKVADWAIITRDEDGTVRSHEPTTADPGAARGAVAGGVAGAFMVLLGPIGIAGVAAAAGVGAVAAALHDSGFKDQDMEAVGALMADGRTILLAAVESEYVDRMRTAIQEIPEFVAADRTLESSVDGSSGNLLRETIAQYKEQRAAGG